MRVHAWVTSSCLDNTQKTIEQLKEAGVTIANFMLNDYADGDGDDVHRAEDDFRTFNVDKLLAMAAACHAAGILVHATTWVMPHDHFIDGMLEQLPWLLAGMGCSLLMLDAEEPYSQATGCFDYASAAERIKTVFPRLALSGIGGALDELTELAKICAVWSPQAYATKTSQATPGGVVPYCIKCWTEKWGSPREGWIMGLAGYKQADDGVSTMQPPIDDLEAADIDDACYWTLRSIHDDPDVVEFVAGLSGAAEPAPVEPPPPEQPVAVGIMPTLPILSMPRVKDHNVLIVQALLQDVYGIDVGELDGIPGPKTEAGVVEFQASRGLPETGVVDPNTWHALLSKLLPQ
jgi:hypothetical protein